MPSSDAPLSGTRLRLCASELNPSGPSLWRITTQSLYAEDVARGAVLRLIVIRSRAARPLRTYRSCKRLTTASRPLPAFSAAAAAL